MINCKADGVLIIVFIAILCAALIVFFKENTNPISVRNELQKIYEEYEE